MLRTFSTESGKLKETQIPSQSESEIKSHVTAACWIDLQEPTDDERLLVESVSMRDILPDSVEVEEIEYSARNFTDDENIHIHSLFLHHTEGRLKTATVAFILKPSQLITYRDMEIADFRLLRLRARRGFVMANTPVNVMLSLFEQKVEDLADAIEDIYKELEDVSSAVLEENNEELEETIDIITRQEDENGKVRMCLMDTQRSIAYLQRHIKGFDDDSEICKQILADIKSLTGHTQFLFDKINFLMTAAQGFVGIEQNQIIKSVSVATVFFLPPTLVASVYGMNFQFIPELHFKYGYLGALGLMVASTAVTFWYFKRKKLL